ncbi:glycosyltransferase [Candidatus Daviesbacteria bacterium]|nr:glycosyltransferase [Candidatus Daviesbacteria bacterium]
MNLLIAPLHYIADKNDGSEYSRAFDYLEYLSKQEDIYGDVLVGFCEKKKMGRLSIISFFQKKPEYISNLTRLKFIFWVFLKSMILIKQNRYDIMWHNGPFALNETFNLAGLVFSKKIPFVIGPIVTPHTFLGEDETRSMGKKINVSSSKTLALLKFFDSKTYFLSKAFIYISNLTLKKAALVIAKDEASKLILKNKGLYNTMILPVGNNATQVVSYKKRARKTTKDIVLLNVSYLVERKRTEDLIFALNILVHKMKITNLILVIVGDGPQKEHLLNLTTRLKLNKYVVFKGYIKRELINKFYNKADIFVSGSISETMPAMYFEAMASGLPMVIAENNTSRELEKYHFGGFVVASGNPAQLAKKIATLILNRSIRERFGVNNRELYISNFEFKKSMDKLKDAFFGMNQPQI